MLFLRDKMGEYNTTIQELKFHPENCLSNNLKDFSINWFHVWNGG